jgi:antitoxin (DNA-binding transcriptional repressor) of toxin-antitoxin stability system
MLDFRQHAGEILGQVQKGQRMILTCCGKPVARLEPIVQESVDANDPFYSLDGLSDVAGESLTNEQIDDVLYGQ